MKKWSVYLMVAALAAGLAALVVALATLAGLATRAGLAAQDKPYTLSGSGVGTLVITSTTVDAVWLQAVRLFMTQDREWVLPPITVTDRPSGLLVGVWAQGKGPMAWAPTISLSFEQDGPDVRINVVPSVVGPKHPDRRTTLRTAAASFFNALLEAMK